MRRSQHYIHSLMDNVAEGQIASDAYRLTFGKIARRLAEAEDFDGELRKLYKVAGFSDFALSLMWIAEEVENDPAKTEYTMDEQQLVVSNFRYAVGDLEIPPVGSEPEVPETFAGESRERETPEMPSVLEMETPPASSQTEPESAPSPEVPPARPGSEADFAGLMEKFVEAMQSGSDDRDELFQAVIAQSKAFLADGSEAPDDLREFCGFLLEFLQYIMENGFMDDVRVMNILSNVSSPVSSWAQASPEAREGILAEGTEILRTFKSLFE
ncbi:MAG: hypothetical protein HBSIN02_21080 [Bacteroidia bacterium]|nr:MAG: hypothetical protein HBSIN02_21080 [Bacteroidia bacterium]